MAACIYANDFLFVTLIWPWSTICQQCTGVRLEDGRVLRRHQDHIRHRFGVGKKTNNKVHSSHQNNGQVSTTVETEPMPAPFHNRAELSQDEPLGAQESEQASQEPAMAAEEPRAPVIQQAAPTSEELGTQVPEIRRSGRAR